MGYTTSKPATTDEPLMLTGYNPAGQWQAEFAIEHAENFPKTDDVRPLSDWKAFLTLGDLARRFFASRVSNRNEQERKQYANRVEQYLLEKVRILRVSESTSDSESGKLFLPRLIQATIKVASLKLRLPDTAGKHIFLDLKFTAPVTAEVILDNPFVQNELESDVEFAFIITSFFLEIKFETGLSWPNFIDQEKTKIVEVGTQTNTRSGEAVSVLGNYLKLPAASSGDSLQIHAGGMTYAGRMPLPWNQKRMIRAEYLLVEDSPGAFSLVIKNHTEWKSEMLQFQDDAVDATDEIKTAFNAPLPSSPAAGLIASGVHDEIRWRYKDNALQFDPGNSLFELEFRGSAAATSRVLPDRVELSESGTTIGFSAGTLAEDDDYIDYHFERASRTNAWTGTFDMVPEPDAFRSLLEKTGQTSAAEILSYWVLTPQGPISIPLESPPSDEMAPKVSQSVMQGILRLSSVPWAQSGTSSLAYPEIDKESNSLLLTDASGISATFKFSRDNQLQCDEIHVRITGPLVRMEQLLPLHIESGLPAEPYAPPTVTPAASRSAHQEPFFGLSFIRSAASADYFSNVNWHLKLDYRPGVDNGFREGSWNESWLSLTLTQEGTRHCIYWFHPDNSLLIPSLPYANDPSYTAERISRNRLYLPLSPQPYKVISFQFATNPHTPTLRSGTFAPMAHGSSTDDADFFEWSHLLLPGISIAPTPGKTLEITQGRLSGGALTVRWRSDLPVLDEIHALMTGAKKKDVESTEMYGAYWWNKLSQMRSLSLGRDVTLIAHQLSPDIENIVAANELPVEIKKLVGRNSISGFLNLSVSESTASLFVVDANGQRVDLISADALLKGLSAKFAFNEQHALIPVVDGQFDFEIEAGSIVPYSIDRRDRRMYADQSGNLFSPIDEKNNHRRVSVFSEEKDIYIDFTLWSCASVELALPGASGSLYFRGLPLIEVEPGKWVFNSDAAHENPLLREYTWGNLGNVYIDHFLFQPFQLLKVVVDSRDALLHESPSQIEMTGVLHFVHQLGNVCDESRQKVTVSFVRSGLKWRIDRLDGRVWWPLFQGSPDLSKAQDANLEMIYPCIESGISFANGSVVFGTSSMAARLVFHFLQKLWSIPIAFVKSNETMIEWKVMEGPAQSGLSPYGGTILLTTDRSISSFVDFQFLLKVNSVHLVDMRFHCRLDVTGSSLDIDSFRAFSRSDSLCLTHVADQIIFDNDQLVVTVNEMEGTRTNRDTLYLLPGWPIDNDAELSGFFKLGFDGGDSLQRIAYAPVTSVAIAFESKVRTPDALSFSMEYRHSTGTTPSWGIHVTGQTRLANTFSWHLEEGKHLRHEVTFTFLDTFLPGRLLDFSSETDTLFDIASPLGDSSEPGGMIDLPGMATHKIFNVDDGDAMIALWTTPQVLWLAQPSRAEIEWFNPCGRNVDPNVSPNGFFGETGIAINELLKGSNTMVLFSTSVFWLRAITDGQLRAEVNLWAHRASQLKGVPVTKQDFGKKEPNAWTRTPVPFLSDAKNVLKKEAEMQESFAKLFNITTTRHLSGKIAFDEVINVATLDTYSLEYQILNPAETNVFPTVQAYPDANNLLAPTMTRNAAFEPAWIVFDNQPTSSVSDEILVSRSRATFHPHDSLKKRYKYDFPNPIVETEEFAFVLQLSNVQKESLLVVQSENDSYSLLRIPATGKESQSITVISNIILSKGDRSIWLSSANVYVDIERVALRQSPSPALKLRIGGLNYAVASRKDVNQIIMMGKTKFKPPVNKDDWMDFSIDIPYDGEYYLDFNLDAATDGAEFSVKQSTSTLGHVLIIYEIDLNKAKTVRIKVTLKSGNRKMRITCTKGSFRLCWFELRFFEPAKTASAFEGSAIAFDHILRSGVTFLAATEVVPRIKKETSAWQRITDAAGKSKPYLLASPLAMLYDAAPADTTGRSNQKIFVEILIPKSRSWLQVNQAFDLFASAPFTIGVDDQDTWETILFNASEVNPLRRRVIDWVKANHAKLPAGSTALLRARASTPTKEIASLKYYTLPPLARGSARSNAPVVVSSKQLLIPDIHFEEKEEKMEDALSCGPEYLGAKVHYVPLDGYEAALPDLPESAMDFIVSFTSEQESIHEGEPVRLSWILREDILTPEASVELTCEDEIHYPKENFATLFPKKSCAIGLTLLVKGIKKEQAYVAVKVKTPVSGSAISISYQLAGVAPGPQHTSRLPLKRGSTGFHRWLEITRDVEFQDLTRMDSISKNEVGWTLPRRRTLRTDNVFNPSVLTPFLATRAALLFSSGRAGTLSVFRSSFLNLTSSNALTRTNSSIVVLRQPRPVPLHPSITPIPPSPEERNEETETYASCSVRKIFSEALVASYDIKWQDPLYNRCLQAAGQEIECSWGKLLLDRKVYSGKDVFYPELHIAMRTVPYGWKIRLTLSVDRMMDGVLRRIADNFIDIDNRKVDLDKNRAIHLSSVLIDMESIRVKRYVFESGLNEPSAADALFNFEFENFDQLTVLAELSGAQESLQLKALIRTDDEIWSQPQNAYAILRKGQGGTEVALAAFGWLQKPKIVKRTNRFVSASWAGTFQYQDRFVVAPGYETSSVQYEIRSITPSGEQILTKPFSDL